MNAVKRAGRVLAVVAIGVSLLGAAACSKDPEVVKREALANGKRYFEQKKYNEAIVEFRRAIQADSSFPEAHQKLAESYEVIGDGGNAAREYIRTADLMPDDVDMQVRAGAYLVLGGAFEDAKSRAQKALAKNPRSVEAQLLLAESLAGLTDINAGLKQVEETIRMQPDEASPFAKLGRFEMAKGNPAKAEEAFKRAVTLDPKSSYAISGLANFYLAVGKTKEAEEWLLKGIELAPLDIAANRGLAAFYLRTGRIADAEKPLKTVADSSPAPAAKLVLADYYFAAGRKADARRVLDAVQQDELIAAEVKLRLSILEYSEGHRAQALKYVDEILSKNAKHAQANLLKGRYALAEPDLAKALPLLKTAIESDPQLAEAHYFLGVTYSNLYELKAARDEFAEVQKLTPSEVGSRIQLVAIDLLEGKAEAALSRAYEAVAMQPNNVQAHTALIDALLANNKLPAALKEATLVARVFPNAPEAHLQLGRIYQKQGDYAASERALARAVELSKGERHAIEALVATRLAAGKTAEARTLVEGEIARRPKESWLRIYAARVYRAEHNTAKAEAAFQEAVRLDPSNLQAYVELTQIYAAENKLDNAREQLEAVVAKLPNEVWAHTSIAMILHVQNRVPEARQRYEKILAIDPHAPIAANNLAMIYLDEGQRLEQAFDLARTAKQQMPESPEINDTLGLAFLRKGMVDSAVRSFEFSVRKDQTNPVYQYHLGLAYERNGDKAKARTALQRALSLHQDFDGASDARRLLSTL